MADVEMEPKVCTFYYKEDFDNVENIGAIVRVIEFPATPNSMIFEGKIGEKYGFMEIDRQSRRGERKDQQIILSLRCPLNELNLSDDNEIILHPNWEMVEYRPGSKEYNDKFEMVRNLYREI